MLKDIEKVKNIEYNLNILKVNNFAIAEPGNIYGHSSSFMKLKSEIRSDAHRVISPLALRLVGIEDTYSVTDINGNTYKFDIFEDGNYRVFDIEKFKDIIKEDLNERTYKENW